MAAATGIASQRVCAKMREFVLGRSILTNSLDESAIVVRIISVYRLLHSLNIGL